jgi:hypothetical protein
MSTSTDIVDLVAHGARVGSGLLQSLTGNRIVKDLGSRLSGGCCCTIPPPCWLPKPLGKIGSHVCGGGTATVRILITNCGPTSRDVTVEATGADAADVTIAPSSLELGPMEQARVDVTLSLPSGAKAGSQKEAVIWVRGCHVHYLRWTVKAARSACDASHEVEVDDCPDYIHHWYDHFYCDHPCPGGAVRVRG